MKVSIGNDPEDMELQSSVDKLLEKKSLHIMNIVKEGHMRKVRSLGNSIEEVRGTLKKNMSNKEMFDLDSAVFQKTETKKNSMTENHKKKLCYLKQRRTERKSTEGENSAHKKRETGKTVSTEKSKQKTQKKEQI